MPQSRLGKALQYALNQKEKLLRFLEDGRISLSNNATERNVKTFVMGRKAWLFCDTPKGAHSSASIYSIMQTAIANNLKPFAYLEYVFEHLQNTPKDKVVDYIRLLPWSEELPATIRMTEEEIQKTNK